MSLKTLIASDVVDVFMDTDAFAHTSGATYYPAAGGNRSINVITNQTQKLKTGEIVDYEDDRISVFVERHATRGISAPAIGDKLALAGDSDTQKYAWNGVIVSADEAAWTLQFVRPKLNRIGTSQRRT